MTPDTAFDAWKHRARSAPIDKIAQRVGAKLKAVTKTEFAGPCPHCGGTDRFSINTKDQVFNCRGAEGGDVIRMVEHVCGFNFLGACEFITDEPPPDRARALTDDDRARLQKLDAERAEHDRKRASDDNAFRERERGTLYDIWRAADADAPELWAYFALRLGPLFMRLPRELRPRVRLVRDMPYYRGGGDRGNILARAPAMVAPLVDPAGKFRALHFTYLDLTAPKGKLQLADPDTGEALPAKKMRGSKKGHWIELFRPVPALSSPPPLRGRPASIAGKPARPAWEEASREGGHLGGRCEQDTPLPDPPPQGGRGEAAAQPGPALSDPPPQGGREYEGRIRQLILGEGIEKTAAVWLALWLAGRDLSATAAWVACDLDNLGGKAAGTVRHPTQRHASGRPVMVGGPEPDLGSPAIVVPDEVEDLVLLGDSTSDRFKTERALARASARYARAGRAVRVAWAPDGKDFDEMYLREAA